jgi:hypothetical protein
MVNTGNQFLFEVRDHGISLAQEPVPLNTPEVYATGTEQPPEESTREADLLDPAMTPVIIGLIGFIGFSAWLQRSTR